MLFTARKLLQRLNRFFVVAEDATVANRLQTGRSPRLPSPPTGSSTKELLILEGGTYLPGMFSEFAAVLGLLEHFEKRQGWYAGVKVDFGSVGLYYDPAVGENWWEYYFEPICVDTLAGARPRIVDTDQHMRFALRAENGMPRRRAAELVERYVRVKRHILEKIEAFALAKFADAFVIGVHYRGTDKKDEAPRIPYETVEMAVHSAIGRAAAANVRIFVASDEQAFVDHMLDCFPGKVEVWETRRSTDGTPIWVSNEENYKKGEDALIDCLLLSRCRLLIRTASDLGLVSTFFNPKLTEVLLTVSPLAEKLYELAAWIRHRFKVAASRASRWMQLALVSSGIPLRKAYWVLHCDDDARLGHNGTDLFSEFAAVLGLLDHQDRWSRIYAGVRVDFGEKGLYFDPAHGPNWWAYYFEPISIGSAHGSRVRAVSPWRHQRFAWKARHRSPRVRIAGILDRHIRVKAHVLRQVDAFAMANFEEAFVIGVHFPGAAKEAEAPYVAYESVEKAIRCAIEHAAAKDLRIFVVSDERAFVDHIEDRFPGRVRCRGHRRPTDGTSSSADKDDNYKRGEDAVIDCLLLSRCHLLIRTTSDLSLCSTFFNPALPEILLTW